MHDELKDIAKDYAKHYPRITNTDTRKQKGAKMAAVLKDFFGDEIRSRIIVDIGASGCIPLHEICRMLQPKVSIGIDLDEDILPPSSDKLITMVADAMDLPFPDASVDIVICNHVYEHVSDSKGLFKELHRVLKSDGIVYFGAMNARWPMEPHYDIPFLHWMPSSLSEKLVRRKGFDHGYLEKPLTTSKLIKLTSQFEVQDYTVSIIENPEKYNATDVINYSWVPSFFRRILGSILYGFLPSYIWVLKKELK